MRRFPMDEMRELLQKERFVNVEFWDNFSDQPGHANSKNLIVTAPRL